MKSLQMMLLLIGSLALILGLMMVTATTVGVQTNPFANAPHSSPMQPNDFVLSGSVSCFTCHSNIQVWDNRLRISAIEDTIRNPRSVMPGTGLQTQTRAVKGTGDTHPYTAPQHSDIPRATSQRDYVLPSADETYPVPETGSLPRWGTTAPKEQAGRRAQAPPETRNLTAQSLQESALFKLYFITERQQVL